MSSTLTYRGNPDLKAELVAEMRAHQAADRLMQGSYFERTEETPGAEVQGCAIGCTVADRIAAERKLTLPELVAAFEVEGGVDSWHEEWARVTGLPEWLAHVDDYLFENLPQARALEWPLQLLVAVPVGVDLDATREEWLRDLVFDPERGSLADAAVRLKTAGLNAEAARLRRLPRTSDWSTVREVATEAADTASNIPGPAADAAAEAAWYAAATAKAAGTTPDTAWQARTVTHASPASREWIADQLLHHLTAAGPGEGL